MPFHLTGFPQELLRTLIGVVSRLLVGLLAEQLFWQRTGLDVVVQHYTLRFWLWHTFPWKTQ